MIYKAKILDGYAAKMPAFEKAYEFKPRLNILFGPNACGKTTLIKILGAYSATAAGWSRFLDPTPGGAIQGSKEGFPERFRRLSPGGCKAEVEWDGTASFLMSPETGKAFTGCFEDSQDGLMSAHDLISETVCKPSEGQSRIMRLLNLFKNAKSIPDLTKISDNLKHVNDVWQESMKAFAKYAKKLPRKGPPTLLLDEVDRSLSIPNHVALWLDILPKMAEKFQIIIATQCESALAHKDSLIEMAPGYIEECRKWISKIKPC